jgi:hypothetical protein
MPPSTRPLSPLLRTITRLSRIRITPRLRQPALVLHRRGGVHVVDAARRVDKIALGRERIESACRGLSSPPPERGRSTHNVALTIAGIFDRWNDPENEGRELLSCPMMTTAPNAHVAKVHDRQVVTRGPDQFSAWLDGTAGTEILVPAPEEAIRYSPVSKRINSVKAPREDKTLIEPITLEPELGTGLLV